MSGYHEFECKQVKCRKTKRCEWCGETIHKGEPAKFRRFVWEGHYDNGWSHPECWVAMQKIANELYDGWSPGDFMRGSTEYR